MEEGLEVGPSQNRGVSGCVEAGPTPQAPEEYVESDGSPEGGTLRVFLAPRFSD